MSVSPLYDNHGRPINYLRLAVTDRCNLRCFYCMPEKGMHYLPKKELLTYEEIERLIHLMAGMGITKVRLTGGEPFVRQDLMKLISTIVTIPGIKEVHLTSNGVFTAPFVPELKRLGIASVNLSLDSLDKETFHQITRRDEYDKVMETLFLLLENDIPVKLNVVVIDGQNTNDILSFVEMTKTYPVSVRFIEEMPFNGEGSHYTKLNWTYKKILSHIQEAYPSVAKIQDPSNTTAFHYQVPGYPGKIGIIAAYSRTFCGTCNRIRLTAKGVLKTCLYDDGVMDIKLMMRSGANDQELKEALIRSFSNRPKDGFEAEVRRKLGAPVMESMSTIGG